MNTFNIGSYQIKRFPSYNNYNHDQMKNMNNELDAYLSTNNDNNNNKVS